MSKRQVLMILGVIIMILLFLGFPSAWDKFFAVAIGAIIVAVSYSIGSAERRAQREEDLAAAPSVSATPEASSPVPEKAPDAAVPDMSVAPSEPITETTPVSTP